MTGFQVLFLSGIPRAGMLSWTAHKGFGSLFSNNHLKTMFLYYMQGTVKSYFFTISNMPVLPAQTIYVMK